MKSDDIKEARKKAALDYHEFPTPGKLSITATKQLLNQSDLALAYSPGVASACEAIVEDPLNVYSFTARGNLVGVVTNGTAVLGLGAIGPLAAKPVMEGKAVLFKKFAGIDVFDIEVEQRDPLKLVELIAALEPTFGAINLEDIKAPECFVVERELRRRMKIPVFHDDQHGTAIIVGAACLKGLQVVGVSLDTDRNTMTRYTDEYAMNWPEFFSEQGPNNPAVQGLHLKGVPSVWVVGKDGCVIAKDPPGNLDAVVEKALAAK